MLLLFLHCCVSILGCLKFPSGSITYLPTYQIMQGFLTLCKLSHASIFYISLCPLPYLYVYKTTSRFLILPVAGTLLFSPEHVNVLLIFCLSPSLRTTSSLCSPWNVNYFSSFDVRKVHDTGNLTNGLNMLSFWQ